ncbi:MAG: MATE family efflux transporter [Treponema sp.]|nr:MATE family efflux transporter [Treponema sp.]
MNKKLDLTAGPLASGIFIFSIPLIFSNILQVMFNMADIAVVGRFAGAHALGAVGSTPMLLFFMTGLLQGIGSGVNVIAAYYCGARSEKDLGQTVHTSFLFCLGSGILILLIAQVFAIPALRLLNTRPELLHDAASYIKIYTLGMPALALYNWGSAVLSATGDSTRPVICLLTAGVTNVILNLVFVIGFKMDVDGVALASAISQYVSAFLITGILIFAKTQVPLRVKQLGLKRDKVKKLVSIGIPSGLQNTIFAFANMFIQVAINSFPPLAVAGIAVSTEIDPLIYNVMLAFYVACASFVGQNFGAHKKDRVKKTFFLCTMYSFLVALVLGLLLYIFRDAVLSLFTQDVAVKGFGIRRISIMSFAYCVSAFMDCTIAASRGLGKTFVPSLIVILGSCVFRIAWVYTIFARFATIESLFLLFPCSWAITAVAEIVYFRIIFNKAFEKEIQ